LRGDGLAAAFRIPVGHRADDLRVRRPACLQANDLADDDRHCWLPRFWHAHVSQIFRATKRRCRSGSLISNRSMATRIAVAASGAALQQIIDHNNSRKS
jgi:hypothetical protein